MSEITLILDEAKGGIVAEDNSAFTAAVRKLLQTSLGEGREIACARPLDVIKLPQTNDVSIAETSGIRIAGYYHNSLIEGPGRRSSVLFQFCPLKCPGCYVPELHSKESGQIVLAKKLAEQLLDKQFERDGVTILGGEPFAQPEGLLSLVRELHLKGCSHIVCYSGYTLESLEEKAIKLPIIKEILDEIDLLIDGSFIELMAAEAGLWTGSGNQRVIDLRETRKQGELVLYQTC